MGDRLALERERRRVAWAAQPAVRRVQPELAALVCADARHRLQLCIGAMHETVDRAEVECERSALGQIGTRADWPPRTGVRFEHILSRLRRLLLGRSPR